MSLDTRGFTFQAPDREGPYRLLLMLHWSTGSGPEMQRVADLDELALENNVILVYPEGAESSWNAGGCCRENAADDVAYLDSVIDHFKGLYAISDIMMFGASNGGMMAWRYWYQGRHQVAGFVIQAASISPGNGFLDDGTVPDPPYPAHLYVWHGLLDTVVPFAGRDSRDQSRAWLSPFVPVLFGVQRAASVANVPLRRYKLRKDGTTVIVWRSDRGHVVRLRMMPHSGHGGQGEPWPGDRYSYSFRWLMGRVPPPQA